MQTQKELAITAERAIGKRKFLLNRLFVKQKVREDEN